MGGRPAVSPCGTTLPGMEATLTLNYPAPIPAGHEIEVTEFADTRPEKKRNSWNPAWDQPFRHPVILDVTTSIRYRVYSGCASAPW